MCIRYIKKIEWGDVVKKIVMILLVIIFAFVAVGCNSEADVTSFKNTTAKTTTATTAAEAEVTALEEKQIILSDGNKIVFSSYDVDGRIGGCAECYFTGDNLELELWYISTVQLIFSRRDIQTYIIVIKSCGEQGEVVVTNGKTFYSYLPQYNGVIKGDFEPYYYQISNLLKKAGV